MASDSENKSSKWNFRKYLTVEPVLICWVLPGLFMYVAMENLGLEKSCRVNLGYSDIVCDNMIDKSLLNITCEGIDDEETPNIANISIELPKLMEYETDETTTLIITTEMNPDMEVETTTLNSTNFPDYDIGIFNISAESLTGDDPMKELTRQVCEAETESQKLIIAVNGYRALIAQIFPIIIILFAGSYSDKKGIRKPCMLFPLLGELFGCCALLITSIFMKQIPMEFGNILERVLPAIFGGQTLMLMGIYSYLTAITKEEDRTSRFTVFAVLFNVCLLAGVPFSGHLYQSLGYIKLFSLCIVIYLIGVLFIIFVLKEVKIEHTDKKDEAEINDNKESIDEVDGKIRSTNGFDNPTFIENENKIVLTQLPNLKENKKNNYTVNSNKPTKIPKAKKEKGCLAEFFDPEMAIGSIKIFLKKREDNSQIVLILLALAYFMFISPGIGEGEYIFWYTRRKLEWDVNQYSYFALYNTILGLAGTTLLTGVISKFFRISDALIGSLSCLLSVISKPLFAFATTSLVYYSAATIDLFLQCRPIALKSIMSRFVKPDELGRAFSVLGILDAVAGFIMSPLYSVIYYNSLEVFPGAIYLFSEIFMIFSFLVFGYMFIKYRKQTTSAGPKTDDVEQVEETDENGMTSINLTERNGNKVD